MKLDAYIHSKIELFYQWNTTESFLSQFSGTITTFQTQLAVEIS